MKNTTTKTPRNSNQTTLTAFAAALMFITAGFAQAVNYTWDPTSGDSQITDGTGNWDTTTSNWTTDGGANNTTIVGNDPFNTDLFFGGGTAGTAGTITLTETGNSFGSLSFNSPNAGTYNLDLNGNIVNIRRTSGTFKVYADATISDSAGGGELRLNTNQFNDYSTGSTLSISAVVADRSGTAPAVVRTYNTITLDLSGNNTYTGATEINGGTVVAGVNDVAATSGALGNGGNIDFGGGTLQYATGVTQDYSLRVVNSASAIKVDTNGETVTWATDLSNTNTGGLIKEGTGTLIIEAESTYGGATTVNGGTLRLLSDDGDVSLQSNDVFAVNNGSTLVFDNDAGNFIVSGSNDVTFDSSGGNTLSIEGSPVWRNASIVTTGGARNFVSGGVLNHQNGYDVIFDVASGTDGDGIDLEVSTQLDRGGIIKNGDGTVLLTNGNNRMIFNRELTINGGTLELGGSSRISTFNNPGTDFNEWTGPVNLNNAGIFKHSSSLDQELSGIISGTGSIVKDGGGTLTLSADNTYQGNTTVSAGTLALSHASLNNIISSSSIIDVAGGATLDVSALGGGSGGLELASGQTLQGSGTVSGGLTVGDGAVLSPGNSPGTQNHIGDLTWSDGGTYLWEINDSGGTQGADPGWDWISITGTLELGGLTAGGFTIDIDSLTLGNVAGNAAGFTGLAFDGYPDVDSSFTIATAGSISGFDSSLFNLDDSGFVNGGYWEIRADAGDLILDFYAVPEPSSTALLGLGGLALMLRRKRS